MPLPDRMPSYAELPTRPGLPEGSAWGVFGDDDEVGCINLVTPSKALEAAALVKTGKSFSLNWELEQPVPAMFRRGNPRHTIASEGYGKDDVLDNFFPQSSSQWDGLTHITHPEHGFYNGVTSEQITGRPGTKNGIEHWAKRGIVTRGVLLDVARYLEAQRRPVNAADSVRFSVADLEATRQAQGVEIRQGDILLLRTGWMAWYLNAPLADRILLANMATHRTPGLEGSMEMVAYLWDLHVAAVAGDNPSLEAFPMAGVSLHRHMIPLLGLPIGEMFFVERLAEDCAADGVYEFMLTSAPLNLLGGVGSPPNAIAIK
jgi:kynurenine formamidase